MAFSRKRKMMLIGDGVLLFCLVLNPYLFIFATLDYDAQRDYLERIRFEAAAWKDEQGAKRKPFPRQRMVDNLLADHPLEGWGREALLALLGEPTSTN